MSDDTGIGLLAIRQLLVGRGLAQDPTAIYWHMPQPDDSAVPALCLDATTSQQEDGRLGLWARLRRALPGARGPSAPIASGKRGTLA